MTKLFSKYPFIDKFELRPNQVGVWPWKQKNN